MERTSVEAKCFREEAGQSRLADVELRFSGGPLDGMKLVRLAVRAGREGGEFVTFPARSYERNGATRYHDFLRSVDGDQKRVDAVKAWILDVFHGKGSPRGEMEVEVCLTDGAPKGRGPLADAELRFKGGPLDGMRLTGLAVREGREGRPFAMLPAQPYDQEGHTKYYDVLRPTDGKREPAEALKQFVVAAWQESAPDRPAEKALPSAPSVVARERATSAAPAR